MSTSKATKKPPRQRAKARPDAFDREDSILRDVNVSAAICHASALALRSPVFDGPLIARAIESAFDHLEAAAQSVRDLGKAHRKGVGNG